MSEILSVCYESKGDDDDSAVMMVFNKDATKIIKGIYGEAARELYKMLTEDKK